VPVGGEGRKSAPIALYSKGPEGDQEEEDPGDVVASMLAFGWRPTMTWEYAVDEQQDKIKPDMLQARQQIAKLNKEANWAEGITFPTRACQAPRLLFGDTMALEQLRRYTAKEGVGVVLTGATLTKSEDAMLKDVLPTLVVHDHPGQAKKIKQAAVVFLDGQHSMDCLIDPDRRLFTHVLERHGKGLVFCAKKDVAERLYKRVMLNHPSVHMILENDEVTFIHNPHHSPVPLGCYVAYSRGVIGVGANILGLRHLVLDARAFRAKGSFIPEEVTPEEYESSQAEERLTRVTQNLGRAFRGEENKTVVIVFVNADLGFQQAIRSTSALNDGAELPTVFAGGADLKQLVDQADRWLEAGGGDWPEGDPEVTSVKKKGRPPKRTKEDVMAAADAAMAAGTSWREFSRKEHVGRVLTHVETVALKQRFAGVVAVAFGEEDFGEEDWGDEPEWGVAS
jgi:hypothetical protein